MGDRIVIIDGNSLINRAYYAMQRPMITKEGIYTQGIYGFLNMLNKIQEDYRPEYMAVAWDRKSPTFRHQEYKEYKAGRKKMPPELAMELPIMKDILCAMSIENLEIDGFEADDIIGTVARIAEEGGLEPYIITGDKDALQLATDVTKVVLTKKGVTSFEIYDRQAMIERYQLSPEQFIDLKGLMGDQSDNIPGIPGIGEKTGIKLLTQFGTVSNLLENTDQITNEKLRAKVEEHAQLAAMSRRLAMINQFVPLDIDLTKLRMTEPDYDRLVSLYVKLEFNSYLKKIQPVGLEHKKQSDDQAIEKSIITSIDGMQLLADIKEGASIVLKCFGDHNHIYKPTLFGVSLLIGEKYYYVNLRDTDVLDKFIRWLNDKKPLFYGHDLKNDYYSLMCYGLNGVVTAFDTAVAQYVLDPAKSNYDMKTLIFEYFHEQFPDEKELNDTCGQLDLLGDGDAKYADFGCQWCLGVGRLSAKQKESLEEHDLLLVYEKVELPLVEVLASMETEGFMVDKAVLESQGKTLKSEIINLETRIHELAGVSFNINSPVQLGEVLFERLSLPAGKKTKRGYSTSADILEKIKDKHPIVSLVLQYRTLSKLNSTYVEGLKSLIGADGRIRAHFQQTVTATGRISCTEPNLQNIPIRDEQGRQLRKAFVSKEECVLVGADYSQIELRILAHLSGDENLISAFNNGDDIHRNTAARVFNLSYDQVTPLDRSRAKAVNFGVIYGMSGFGLSENLNITRKEAESYIKDYFNKHQAVKAYMEGEVSNCREKGYTKTLMGRKRFIHEIHASNFMTRQLGERLAMNSPIQGTAADIIKIAMVKVYHQLKDQDFHSKLILQVHDELIIEAVEDELDAVKKLLIENMESAMNLKVKLECDLNEGLNWYELK